METDALRSMIKDVVAQAQNLMRNVTDENAPVNYACIFSQNQEEYQQLQDAAKHIGSVARDTASGPLFQIQPLPTVAGELQLLKIRHPDSTRPERGDADFTLSAYEKFKQEHLGKPGFSLINKGEFEMLEYMEDTNDVRVYFSHPPLDQQLGLV